MNGTIDFDGINAAALRNGRALVQELIPGGQFRSLEYKVRNPTRNDQTPGSFSINYRTGVWKDFATSDGGSDFISLVAYIRGIGQADAARELANKLGVPYLKANGHHNMANSAPAATIAEAPIKVHLWGNEGPPIWPDEMRRHVYRDIDGRINKIKIKKTDGGYSNWYAVQGGWQAKKPSGFQPVPYVTTSINPFDPELKDDHIFWPEGEKDVNALETLNLPAFTFGGAGDGLPTGIECYLKGRHLLILADNDEPGRKHAADKATLANSAGAASIKLVHFPELPEKGDVSDFIAGDVTADKLIERIDATPLWQHPSTTDGVPASTSSGNGQSELVMRCMADVQPEKIEWLWPGRIAIGKQTLIGGEPGLGKSQITAALAAAVTTGGLWPCDEGRAPKGSVLILSAEDDAADTIRPRLDAAGADPYAVRLISAVVQNDGKGRRTFNLQADLSLLETAIKSIGDVRLVIIDPVSSYLGKTDSHKNADVRGTLEPLGDMASRLRVAVVSITHFSKGSGQSAVNSFIGSIAFVAAARAAFIVTRDPESEDPARRLFVQAKNNLAADHGGLAFRVEQRMVGNDILASAIAWESEKVTRNADEILAASRDTKSTPERVEAEEFLREFLRAGPRAATEVEAEAKDAGLSWATVRRAQKSLRIKPYRKAESGDGLGKQGRWYWALPNTEDAPKVLKSPYVAHVSNVSTLGNSEHLRPNGGRS